MKVRYTCLLTGGQRRSKCLAMYSSATCTPTTKRIARASGSCSCIPDWRTRGPSRTTCLSSPGRFHVFRPNRRGHGRSPDVEGRITYELMAQDTIAFLEGVVGGPAYLLGHSDGAAVALLAALEATRPGPRSGPQRRRLPPRRLGSRRERPRRRDDRLLHRLLGRRHRTGATTSRS